MTQFEFAPISAGRKIPRFRSEWQLYDGSVISNEVRDLWLIEPPPGFVLI
jgi:hypothetical protein